MTSFRASSAISVRAFLSHFTLIHILSRSQSWSPAWLIAETVRICVDITSAIAFTRLDVGDVTDAHALAEYKNKGGLKADDLRRRREEQQVEIRRQKREENITKRRNFLPTTADDSEDESTGTSWGDSAVCPDSRRVLVLRYADLLEYSLLIA